MALSWKERRETNYPLSVAATPISQKGVERRRDRNRGTLDLQQQKHQEFRTRNCFDSIPLPRLTWLARLSMPSLNKQGRVSHDQMRFKLSFQVKLDTFQLMFPENIWNIRQINNVRVLLVGCIFFASEHSISWRQLPCHPCIHLPHLGLEMTTLNIFYKRRSSRETSLVS